MRIIYTIALVLGLPLFFLTMLFLSIMLDDWMTHRFGKPPLWFGILMAAFYLLWGLAIFANWAWKTAGDWVK